MICQPTDVELETIISRIKNEDINLQPNFQRGEVWSENKKKKLIDSILRGWKIPPIHMILGNNNIDEVLDGQQRLASIREFFNNKIRIDGNIQPRDEEILKLDGLLYEELPIEIQRKLRRYSITLIRLSDYRAEEPAELFYRLNQPATLTAAEQRNAYIGETRNQIKRLVEEFESIGGTKETVGFSNSRLAYDEIISKFAYMIEINTLRKKVTAGDISKKYRESIPYSNETIEVVRKALKTYIECMKKIKTNYDYCPKHSKATLVSWLIYVTKSNRNIEEIETVMYRFESTRDYLKGKIVEKKESDDYGFFTKSMIEKYMFTDAMMNIYNQRASMGSTDALSVIYRDIILSIFTDMLFNEKGMFLLETIENFTQLQNMNSVLDEINNNHSWGDRIK
ncbi:MAG: DUF262 domain-containing protein [Lachnospiraceae bacterium]|nr:DUF262 domain-containing protein [Lachnospiraceae bacterium]